jgi:tetratricopeptide (TPR) repeat protein
MAHLGLQDAASAERLFRESLKLEPNSVDSNFQLGLLYTKQYTNPEQAIKLLEKARALQPRMAGIHTALGSALLQSGKPEEAARSLETAMELAPDNAGLDGKAEAALAEFNTRNAALADQRAREMRGRAYYQQGADLLANTDQLDQAYGLLEKAEREVPGLDAGYYRMAQIRYLKGELKGASSLIREALRLNALEPEYYYVLARCLENSEPPRALDAVRTAVALRPGVPDFQELLRTLEHKKHQ